MISIIISSRNQGYFTSLQANISNTIGVEYEIIKIDNPGKMGICEAYNQGIAKAKYDILCFAHEDIGFVTKNWGDKVLDIFNSSPDVGLLGAAGNVYKSLTPSHWSFPTANNNSFFLNVILKNQDNELNPTTLLYSNPKNCQLQQVATIDGFWFCVPIKVIQEFPFDEITCSGFHGYDIDYSLTVQEKYKVVVTFEVLIQHFSAGTFKKKWIDATIKVHKKWKEKLPVLIEHFDGFNQQSEEKKAFIFFMKKMVDYGYSLLEILKIYQFQNKNFKFSFNTFISTSYKLIDYKYLNKRKKLQNHY